MVNPHDVWKYVVRCPECGNTEALAVPFSYPTAELIHCPECDTLMERDDSVVCGDLDPAIPDTFDPCLECGGKKEILQRGVGVSNKTRCTDCGKERTYEW